jgi:hypothetical protein
MNPHLQFPDLFHAHDLVLQLWILFLHPAIGNRMNAEQRINRDRCASLCLLMPVTAIPRHTGDDIQMGSNIDARIDQNALAAVLKGKPF